MYYLTKKEKSYYSKKLYQGEIKNSQRNGFGIQIFGNGCLYIGFFSKNQANGKGLFILKDSTTYKGEYYQNYITKGVINYFNGSIYEGEFDNTPLERFKNGTFFFKSGPRFTGEWYEGSPIAGVLSYHNIKIDEIPKKSEITYKNDKIGVFISSKEKWLYEGGLENNVYTGKGIVYCSFQQYKMGEFKNNMTNGEYYKMSINWGCISSGFSKNNIKCGFTKKIFNNGFYLNYEIGKLEAATVTFPFFNKDFYKGKVILDENNTFSIILSKGIYYEFIDDNKFRAIDIFNVSNISELQVATNLRNINFDFSFNEFIKKKKNLVVLKNFVKDLYKENVVFDESFLPECLKMKKKESEIKIRITNLDLSEFEIARSIREKYAENNNIRSRSKTGLTNLKSYKKKVGFTNSRKTGLRNTRSISPFIARKSKLNDKNNLNSTRNSKRDTNLLKTQLKLKSKKSLFRSMSRQNSDLKKSETKKNLKLVKIKNFFYTPNQISQKKFFIQENNINFFEGKILKGLKQGKGRLVTNDEVIYKGFFEDNILKGKGKVIYKNFIYKGNFKNGILEGFGKLVIKKKFSKGGVKEIYEGKFINGIFFNDLILIKKNMVYFFEKKLEKEILTGKVKIFFGNFFLIFCKIINFDIQEGEIGIQDKFGNKYKGFIKKKKNKNIFKAFCKKLGKAGYFEINVFLGLVRIFSC